MKKLVIFGAGDFARVARVYFFKDAGYEVSAFTVDDEYLKQDRLLELPVTPFSSLEDKYPPNRYALFVARRHDCRRLLDRRGSGDPEEHPTGRRLPCEEHAGFASVELGSGRLIMTGRARQGGGAKRAVLKAIASYLPEHQLTNEDLAR